MHNLSVLPGTWLRIEYICRSSLNIAVTVCVYTGPCTPAFEGAPLISSDAPAMEAGEGEDARPNLEPFPVIVFSHGLSGMRTMHCGVCGDLASHGCVVAAVEHRFGFV